MRKAILMMLLAAVSGSAAAEWVEVSHGENTTAYFDPAKISRSGNIVEMLSLLDFKTADVSPGGKPFMSAKILQEHDCKKKRTRLLGYSWYSGNMGGGGLVSIDPNTGKWGAVPPESINEDLWKFVCGKWARVKRDETATYYANPATIRRTGDMVKMWELHDFKTAQVADGVKPYMSARAQSEYDCKGERRRTLSISSYSGNMARGEVMESVTNPSELDPVAPGGLGELMWKLACGKR